MIDFRYHLISIVAVFLALGIGILMGSFVLGENLVDQLNRELEDIQSTNDELRDRTVELAEDLENAEGFALALRAHLVNGSLEARDVVLLTYQDTSGAALDAARSTLELAGAEVPTTITFGSKLALAGEVEVEQLALIVSSSSDDPDELRADLGALLGRRFAAAAMSDGDDGLVPGEDVPSEQGPRPADTQLDRLLDPLEEAAFLEVDGPGDAPVVPAGAVVLVVSGAENDPPFPLPDLSLGFLTALGAGEIPAVVGEGSDSSWELTTMVRAAGSTQDSISSVDSIDATHGPIGLALTLQNAAMGNVGGHYGTGTGSEALVPPPAPSPTEEPTPSP